MNKRLHEEACNDENQIDGRDIVVGSLDCEAWYPSFRAEKADDIIRKRLEKGPADIQVDDLELSRFLTVGLSDKDIEEENLGDLVHRVKDGEHKPRFTDQEITGGAQFREGPRSKLLPPGRQPSSLERNKMSAIAMGWIVKHTMKNFLYTFGGQDRKQKEGGPIGDKITQAVSRHLGNEFDEGYLEKCEKLEVKVELYDRYADDQNIAMWSFGRELKFCPLDGGLVPKSEDEIRHERDKREDELVMEELKRWLSQ